MFVQTFESRILTYFLFFFLCFAERSSISIFIGQYLSSVITSVTGIGTKSLSSVTTSFRKCGDLRTIESRRHTNKETEGESEIRGYTKKDREKVKDRKRKRQKRIRYEKTKIKKICASFKEYITTKEGKKKATDLRFSQYARFFL